MNNPYRARPGRPRVDPTATAAGAAPPITTFGGQNQNSWTPINSNTQSKNIYQNQQHAGNQSKKTGDSWDWDPDNGNDSWNWSIDQFDQPQPTQQLQLQQPQSQQQNPQTHQQQQQQQRYGSNYTNVIQPHQNYVQENYYTNINGNNRQIPPPVQNFLPANPPRITPSRESTPSQSESNTPYLNYNINQLPTPALRPSPTKSNSSINESPNVQSQCLTNQPPDRQESSQYSHASYFQPTPQGDVTNRPPLSHPQQSTNDYAWNDVDLSNATKQQQQQQHWQNQMIDTTGPPRQETNFIRDDPYKSVNQWPSQQQQQPQQINPAMESTPALRPNVLQNPPPKPHTQYENPNLMQSWQLSHSQHQPLNQWPEKPVENFNKLTENNSTNYAVKNTFTNQNWQHEQSPVAVSTPNMITTDVVDEAVAVTENDILLPRQNPLIENKPGVLSTMEHTEYAHTDEVTDDNKNSGKSEDILNDLTGSVNKLNLVDNSQIRFENRGPLNTPHLPPQSADQWPVPSMQYHVPQPPEEHKIPAVFANSQEPHNFFHENTVPDSHISVQQSSHHHLEHSYVNSTQPSISNQSVNVENITMPQPTPKLVPPPTLHETKQPTMIQEKTPDALGHNSQTGYDQWYNQNAAARTQPQQSPWYPNVNRNLHQKQWTSTDSPVDNYETIQPPTEFISADTTTPESSSLYERDNRELAIKDNSDDSKAPTPPRDPSIVKNLEQPIVSQQIDLPIDNYEFASNDRNTFLETGELTDSHHEQELIPPNQEEENDDVPGDIPFLREVPGQSSYADPRRNDPTGQEQYVQSSPRLIDPRRNDPSGQAQNIPRSLSLNERSERRDVPSGEERRESVPLLSRETDTLERRNDPSGRERSLPPAQSRNDPSGEERIQSQSQIAESNELRQVPGSGDNSIEPPSPVDVPIRQIPGGVSSIDITNIPDNNKNNTRVVTGSQEAALTPMLEPANETRNKREEAVGASMREDDIPVSSSPKRRDSYEDGDDEESGNSRDENRERRRDPSPNEKRRYDYDRKGDRSYYDRDREYDDEYYYDRRRGPDYERAYNSREDLDRRETSFREGDRRHPSRDDVDERRGGRLKEDEDRDLRRRDERKTHRIEDPRYPRRDGRDYDPRYPRDPREYTERRREDRRRRYDEYDPRDPRREYYDDPYARNSRPSSRSSYNDRDYYMRSRDPYYGYNGYGSYEYSANYNANYYAYLENLRRTNPTAYMEWYHKYYASQQQQQQQQVPHVANYSEDRASVHSGRSSCEDRNMSAKQSIGDISLLDDSRATSRMTPTKFSSSHVQGSFSIGSLIHVHASYPADGERARVDILRVDSLLHQDPAARELRSYPGPLIKGVTHKKTIIEYCETKIKKATMNDELFDRASYILLYQLMIMLIQQNGNVVGVDIAALLLRNKKAYPYDGNKVSHEPERRASTISQRSGGTGRDESIHENGSQHNETEEKPQKTIQQMTNEFRNTLLDGLVQQALEYAMNEGLWGHALFLASKLDKRTHASVMTRFANSLPVQDPLQTLYQLHSGRVPASMTCVADSKWDDWRPHLAMVISNASANPEINRRSITTLGDTLATRGDIHAAHFCYILAEIEFDVYGTSGAKLVLIGANHHKSYSEFVTPEAVMLTEIYEYARNLSEPGCTLVGLQTFKLETAQKMVDYGLIEKALLYLEQIAVNIVNEPTNYNQSFINDVYTLSDRIKFHDPVFKDCIEDDTTLAWLNNLAEIVGRYKTGEIVHDAGDMCPDSHQQLQDQEQHDIQRNQHQQQQQWNYGGNQDYNAGPVSTMEVTATDAGQDQWQPSSLPPNIQEHNIEQNGQYSGQMVDQYHQPQSQQEYWGQQQFIPQDYSANDYHSTDWQQQQQPQQIHQQEQNDIDLSQQQPTWNYEPASKPQISMGPSSNKQYDPLEELEALESPSESSKPANDRKKVPEKQLEKKAANASGGGSWIGGLFSKLTTKPKNQMILPDDNNPTIVWDSVAKKWMNKDEDGESGSARVAPPPPKITDMGIRPAIIDQKNSSLMPEPGLNLPGDNPTPNTSTMITGSNMFKLQKGRNARAKYIDVLRPGAVKNNGPHATAPTPAASPLVPMAASSPQFFTPQSVQDPNAPVDFLTPTQSTIPSSETTSQGLSRWSSTSSLSREVQSYTMRDPRVQQRMKGPMMYNPNDLKHNSTNNISRSRFPPR